MRALYIAQDSAIRSFTRSRNDTNDGGEKWLQEVLFSHPDLVPLNEIDPGAGGLFPICREYAFRSEGRTVFLDLLGITRTGKLALVECKLWRNPESRREVVGQILEYAALLCQLSYSDLEASLKQRLGWSGENPLFRKARECWPDLEEAQFVDAVQRSLQNGDYILVIVGDGIRSDAQSIARFIEQRGGLALRLGLVEIQRWISDAGEQVLVPTIQLRTETVSYRVITDAQSRPLLVEPGAVESDYESVTEGGSGSQSREANKQFWQRFAERIQFSHPDQDRRARAGNNFVWLPFVPPSERIVVYRSGGSEIGVFLRMRGDLAEDTFEALKAEKSALEEEVGVPLEFAAHLATTDAPTRYDVLARRKVAITDPRTEEEQLVWLSRTADAMVTAFRPRFTQLERSRAATM